MTFELDQLCAITRENMFDIKMDMNQENPVNVVRRPTKPQLFAKYLIQTTLTSPIRPSIIKYLLYTKAEEQIE